MNTCRFRHAFAKGLLAFTAVWNLSRGNSSLAAQQAPLSSALEVCGSGTVKETLSGDRVQLTSGEVVKLADVKAPELWISETPYKSWPFSYEARDTLKDLLNGKSVELFCAKEPNTLTGDLNAHLLLDGSQWVQQTLLESGAVFFFRTIKSSLPSDKLLQAEALARSNLKGLWRLQAYQIRPATHPKTIIIGWFQLVEGQVLSAKRVRDSLFLNFGPNWRKDFTLDVPARYLKQLGLDQNPSKLEGKHIRVRGWAEWAGGPKIILDSPQNLEVLQN